MKALLKSLFYSKFIFFYITLIYIAIIFNGIFSHNFFVLLVFPFNISLIFSAMFFNTTQKNLFKEFLISSPLGKKGFLNTNYLIGLIFNIITIAVLFIAFFIRLNLNNKILIENIELSNYILLFPIFSTLLINNSISILCLNIANKNIQSIISGTLLFVIIFLFKAFLFSNIFKYFDIKCIFLTMFGALFYIFSYFISRRIN